MSQPTDISPASGAQPTASASSREALMEVADRKTRKEDATREAPAEEIAPHIWKRTLDYLLDYLHITRQNRKLVDLLCASRRIITIEEAKAAVYDEHDASDEAMRKTWERLEDDLAALQAFGIEAKVSAAIKGFVQLEVRRYDFSEEPKCAPRFRWKQGREQHSIPVCVPLYGPDSRIILHVESEPWSPPSAESDYERFKSEMLKKHECTEAEAKNLRWHVRAFKVRPSKTETGKCAIELCLRPVAHEDVVATSWNLDGSIRVGPTSMSVRKWLATGRSDFAPDELTHFVPAANPLMVQVVIVGNDNRFIARWNHTNKRWDPTVVGFVDGVKDVYRNNLDAPDISETFFRKCIERIGLNYLPARVEYMGVCFGQVEGKVSILGQLRVPKPAQAIIDEACARGKSARWAENQQGPGALCAVDLTASSVLTFSLGMDPELPSNQFQALLALALQENRPDENIKIDHWVLTE